MIPPVLVDDLLHDRDRKALRALHGALELPRLEQVTYRTGIQPRIAPPPRNAYSVSKHYYTHISIRPHAKKRSNPFLHLYASLLN